MCARVPVVCEKVIDLGIILDSSSSIGSNWLTLKSFVKDFVKTLNVGQSAIRVALVRFSSSVNVEFYLDAHNTMDELLAAIDQIPFAGQSSDLASGIRMLRENVFSGSNGDRSGVVNVGVVIVDGNPNSPSAAIAQAKVAKEAGITMVVLGVTNGVSLSHLQQLASDSSDVVTAATFTDLGGIIPTLASHSCVSQSYQQSGMCRVSVADS